MRYVFLTLSSLVIGYGVVFAGRAVAQARGEARDHELICMLMVAVLGLVYWLWQRNQSRAPRMGAGLDWMMLLPPVYGMLQVAPLPLSVVRILSPAKARLIDALSAIETPPQWVSLSVAPSATTFHALLLTTCVVLFLVTYDLAWRMDTQRWAMITPLLALAVAEAGLGLAQVAANPDGVATGTYNIRNHYAGLLEMALPFAVLYPIAALRRTVKPYFKICLAWGAAAVILAGILLSLSRMGFLSTLGSIVFLALMGLLRRNEPQRNAFVLGGVIAGALVIFLLLPPGRLVLRFGDVTKEDSTEGRSVVWRASLPLIAEYPLVGCGLGGYGSVFPAVKTSGVSLFQDYAHNDYVQYAIELGLLGIVMFVFPLTVLLRRLTRAWREESNDARWLTLACMGSMLAIGLHSVADFNLYVPANMFVFAWILGVAAHAQTVTPVRAGLEPVTHRRAKPFH